MGDKPKKKKTKKPKAKASKEVNKKPVKGSRPPVWAKATRYDIYRG